MENTEPKNQTEKPWILNLIAILFFIGLAWWSYSHITSFEEHGGVMVMNKFLSFLYEIGGKITVICFWLLFAGYNFYRCIIWWLRK